MKYDISLRSEYHPIANLEPMMLEEDLDVIVASMESVGFKKTEPIIMYEGMILDGRNRTIAAEYVGIKTKTREFKGTYEEAEAESKRLNRARRHLKPSQKAMVAAREIFAYKVARNAYQRELKKANPKISRRDILVKKEKRYPKITTAEVAKKHAASPKYVSMCNTYLNETRFALDEMTELIFDGKMDMTKAKHKYKDLKEAYMMTGREQKVYTDEELEIFEKEDMAKNHPRAAALEIVLANKVNNELRDVIDNQEKRMWELIEELSVLRAFADDVEGKGKPIPDEQSNHSTTAGGSHI